MNPRISAGSRDCVGARVDSSLRRQQADCRAKKVRHRWRRCACFRRRMRISASWMSRALNPRFASTTRLSAARRGSLVPVFPIISHRQSRCRRDFRCVDKPKFRRSRVTRRPVLMRRTRCPYEACRPEPSGRDLQRHALRGRANDHAAGGPRRAPSNERRSGPWSCRCGTWHREDGRCTHVAWRPAVICRSLRDWRGAASEP